MQDVNRLLSKVKDIRCAHNILHTIGECHRSVETLNLDHTNDLKIIMRTHLVWSSRISDRLFLESIDDLIIKNPWKRDDSFDWFSLICVPFPFAIRKKKYLWKMVVLTHGILVQFIKCYPLLKLDFQIISLEQIKCSDFQFILPHQISRLTMRISMNLCLKTC